MPKKNTLGIQPGYIMWPGDKRYSRHTVINMDDLDCDMLLASKGVGSIEIIFHKKRGDGTPPELRPAQIKDGDIFQFEALERYPDFHKEVEGRRFHLKDRKESYSEFLPGPTISFEVLEDRKLTPTILKQIKKAK